MLSEPAIPPTFALHLIRSLQAQLPDEIRWIETNHEDTFLLLSRIRSIGWRLNMYIRRGSDGCLDHWTVSGSGCGR